MPTLGDKKKDLEGNPRVFEANRTWELDTSTAAKAVTTDIEAGYFTMASSVPKLAFRDTTTDAYKALYGELVHPIKLTDREFMPNVAVISIDAGAGAGGKDRLSYVEITQPMIVDAASHGLSGDLFIGSDGELTDTPPTDTFRRVACGRVVDADRVLLTPGTSEELQKPITKSYPATVWSNFKSTAYKTASIADGSVEVVRDNAVLNASPNATAMLSAINDPDNADELRFSAANTGIEIEFETKAYVSDVVLQFARRAYWTSTTTRATCDLLVYTNAADGSPAATIKIWATADGTVTFDGINTVVPVNQQCEKIKIQWAATTGANTVQGSIQGIKVRGAKRKETISISPGAAKVPYDDWKLDKPIIRRSERIDTLERERSGIAEDTNLLYPTYAWGWGRSWNTGTDTASTVDRTIVDRRAYRDWVYDGNYGKYNDDYQWLAIDHESTEWQYHPSDTAQQIADRDASWLDTFAAVRALSPNQFAGAYLFPYTAFSAVDGYITGTGGVAHGYFANTILRENNAAKLYEMCDVMMPVTYRQDAESMEDWKANFQHRVNACHQRGRMCVPFVGAMNSAGTGSYWGESDFREMLAFALRTADGVMLWEQITAYPTTGGVPSGTNPYTPTVIDSITTVVREEVERIQDSDEAPKFKHIDITADAPNVEGYTSGTTDGSGLTLNTMAGGSKGMEFKLHVSDSDEIVASSDVGGFDFGSHGTPPPTTWTPTGGGYIELIHDGAHWCRAFHQ